MVSAGNKGKAEKAGLGYASLNHFSGVWHTGDVPSCHVPGPGGLGQVGSGPECDRLVVGGVSVYLKSALVGELFTISRNWLTLEGLFLQCR